MIARSWRGWAAADTADEVAAHLRNGPLARFASMPGNISACVLQRPLAGGVELMTFSLWDSADSLPAAVEENHRLLVARQTVVDCWDVVGVPEAVAEAA